MEGQRNVMIGMSNGQIVYVPSRVPSATTGLSIAERWIWCASSLSDIIFEQY